MRPDQALFVETPALDSANIFSDLEAPRLYEEIVRRNEAIIAQGGALVVDTGAHTGRSPQDKFIVRDAITEKSVWWTNAQAMTPAQFDRLYFDMLAQAQGRELFAQRLYACAAPAHRLRVQVYTEHAWHSLFIRNLLIRPSKADLANFASDMTILHLPSFKADPLRHGCRSQTVIALNFTRRMVLIGGTEYAGEIKKAVFTYLNFFLPAKGVLPMHCAVNDDERGAAVFFGLSGTGKTTLSADPMRRLIGDDEHGWADAGLFNFEGGCYAKAHRLSRENEPEIFAASERFGAILENVTLEPLTRRPDFNDDTKTENTRIAYPLDFIANASLTGCAPHPKNIVMLTCDAFGVLPPIAKLTPAQAMYHFLSGYTAKVAGTERGVREPQATFSTCFGAPFLPRHPIEYSDLLGKFIERHKSHCWLLNTGWTGGKFGMGRRMPIALTRKLLHRALDGSLARGEFRVDPLFGLSVPLSAPGVDSDLLDPINTWSSRQDFYETAEKLVHMFRANFSDFAPYVSGDVLEAQPRGPAWASSASVRLGGARVAPSCGPMG